VAEKLAEKPNPNTTTSRLAPFLVVEGDFRVNSWSAGRLVVQAVTAWANYGEKIFEAQTVGRASG